MGATIFFYILVHGAESFTLGYYSATCTGGSTWLTQVYSAMAGGLSVRALIPSLSYYNKKRLSHLRLRRFYICSLSTFTLSNSVDKSGVTLIVLYIF